MKALSAIRQAGPILPDDPNEVPGKRKHNDKMERIEKIVEKSFEENVEDNLEGNLSHLI